MHIERWPIDQVRLAISKSVEAYPKNALMERRGCSKGRRQHSEYGFRQPIVAYINDLIADRALAAGGSKVARPDRGTRAVARDLTARANQRPASI